MLRLFLGFALFALCVVPSAVMAADIVVEPSVAGVTFQWGNLFEKLLELVMTGATAAIGFAATIWAVSLIWRKVRSFGKG